MTNANTDYIETQKWDKEIADLRETVAMFDKALREDPSDPHDIRDLRDYFAGQIARVDAGEDPRKVFAFPKWTLEEARA